MNNFLKFNSFFKQFTPKFNNVIIKKNNNIKIGNINYYLDNNDTYFQYYKHFLYKNNFIQFDYFKYVHFDKNTNLYEQQIKEIIPFQKVKYYFLNINDDENNLNVYKIVNKYNFNKSSYYKLFKFNNDHFIIKIY